MCIQDMVGKLVHVHTSLHVRVVVPRGTHTCSSMWYMYVCVVHVYVQCTYMYVC